MAVGNDPFPDMPAVPGICLASACAGIKTADRDDLVLMELSASSRVAGVFTRNAFCAAPVTVCRTQLAQASPRYLVINSGNANACTGEQGMRDAQQTCALVAEQAGVATEQVLPFSTGVIGEPMPMERLAKALPELGKKLNERAWADAARAIMTTDTRPKGFTGKITYQGNEITVNGIAKGAGMINPNMGTMLAYIATDAKIAQPVLEKLNREAANRSFNRITIDGDTSTNDACVLIATGQTGPEVVDEQSDLYQPLRDLIEQAHVHLAKSIVRDGEGATKFVTLDVSGGATNDECLQVAYAVAHSPLVKTALFASDPNWGRIVAAIGYAGIEGLDPSKVNVQLQDTPIVQNGGRAPGYTEAQGQKAMAGEELTVRIQLGRGQAQEQLWTTDLSHEYVRINADYRS